MGIEQGKMSDRTLKWSCRSAFFLASALVIPFATAQQPATIPLGIGPGPAQGNQRGGQQNQGIGGGPGLGGGAAQADFDSLIDLIQSTVSADTWMDNGTGEGEVQPFPNGVFADAQGILRFAKPPVSSAALSRISHRAQHRLAMAPNRLAETSAGVDENVRQSSPLRYVSLTRLEATIRARQLRREPLPEAVLTLAGLQRVQYVLVLPPSSGGAGDSAAERPGEILIAGPAGDWQVLADGKIVSVATGQPVVRLDDLLTLWRRHTERRGAPFGVSINPRQQGLAKVQDYVRASSARPIQPSQRREWLEGLQQSLGQQDVEFFGIDPDSHVARVLLVADYHMKLIGMGLADGVEGVASYLSSIEVGPDGSVPPMTILRWWFAMQYEAVLTSADRNVFLLQGPGAKVLSENELLAARGRRIHTGESETLNQRFADSFSDSFEQICQKYPLYSELRNVFDLSMVLELVEREGLVDRAGWQPSWFASADWLPLPLMSVPSAVETVVNHRVIRRKHIVAGVSGGVWIDAPRTLEVKVSPAVIAPDASAQTAAWAADQPTPEGATGAMIWWWD